LRHVGVIYSGHEVFVAFLKHIQFCIKVGPSRRWWFIH